MDDAGAIKGCTLSTESAVLSVASSGSHSCSILVRSSASYEHVPWPPEPHGEAFLQLHGPCAHLRVLPFNELSPEIPWQISFERHVR
jgi:hypothetical protein